MKCLMQRMVGRIRRVREEIYCRKRFLVYSADLTIPAVSSCTAAVPVKFDINVPESLTILRSRGEEYEIDEPIRATIDRQLTEGEICVSGWVGGEMVYCGWIQFTLRQLGRRCTLPIPAGAAFIYRCFTRADYRGKHIYPAALNFTCRWLAARGYQRALIDHQADNSASQAGIIRAGMRPVAEYTVVQFLRLRWAVPDQALCHLISKA